MTLSVFTTPTTMPIRAHHYKKRQSISTYRACMLTYIYLYPCHAMPYVSNTSKKKDKRELLLYFSSLFFLSSNRPIVARLWGQLSSHGHICVRKCTYWQCIASHHPSFTMNLDGMMQKLIGMCLCAMHGLLPLRKQAATNRHLHIHDAWQMQNEKYITREIKR